MKLLIPKRRLGIKQRPGHTGKWDTTPWTHSKFDEATGQVYVETTLAVPSSDDRDWTRQSGVTRRSRGDVEYLKTWGTGVSEEDVGRCRGMKRPRTGGFKGARSLQDCAIESVLENISDITLEGIECLPVQIVRQLWDEVDKRSLASLDTWCIFSKILHSDTSTWSLMRYRQAIRIPNSRLHVYTDPLISKSFDFLASLSITTSFPVPDLIRLSGLTNLSALEIVNTQGYENDAISDRLIRAWHLAALNNGAFMVLRILKLWNHENLTSKSLVFLNSFVSLAVYDVRGCSFDCQGKVEARRLGWQPTLDIDILRLFQATCSERAAVMRTSLESEVTITKSPNGPSSDNIWDVANVKRIPRSEISTFLARADLFAHGKPIVETEASQISPQSQQQRYHKAQFRDVSPKLHDEQLMSKIRGPESWDLANYKLFARIGELRNDRDLARAGVPIGDQAVIGNELVNSVPMVSLCLGQTRSLFENFSTNSSDKCLSNNGNSDSSAPSLQYDWKEEPRLATSNSRGLCFIRIKARLPADSAPQNSDQKILARSSNKDLSHGPEAPQTALPKRQALVIATKKKRKLDDVLGSFL